MRSRFRSSTTLERPPRNAAAPGGEGSAGPARSRARLGLLTLALALAAAGLAAQRLWLSPEARERRLQSLSLAELEQRGRAGRADPLTVYWLGRRRLEAGDAAGAQDAFTAALRADPHFARARAALGTMLLAQDRDQEAGGELRRAIDDDPTTYEAWIALAALYGRYEAWKRQADAAENAIRLHPRVADGWLLRGRAATEMREPARAAECYERAAALAPASAAAHAFAARAQLALNRLGAAERQARAAVAAGPGEALAYTVLGEALARRGGASRSEGEAAFRRAIALGDAGGDAALGLGQLLLAERRYGEAEAQFRAALRADSGKNEARYGLIRALTAAGRLAEAAAIEREFAGWHRFEERRTVLHNETVLNHDDPKPWFALARLYAGRQLWVAARRVVLSGLQRSPGDAGGLRLLREIEVHAR